MSKKTNKNNKEGFGNEDIQDTCHYICSSVNWLNVFFLLLIIFLIYAYFKQIFTGTSVLVESSTEIN